MKRLLPLMLALVLVISVIVPAYATGDGNFDGGGGGMGNGSKTNYWNPGMDGVRVSIVGVGSHSVVRNPIDLTNKVPAANVAHFGKVSKLSYNAGRGLSVSVSGYSYRNPSQSLPKIISTGSSKASIAAIRSYFTDEQVMLSNERYCGDAILQKSVTIDCIEKKRKKNTGEAPMYYVQNNHPAIIDRVTFNKVQEELARRKTKTPGSAKSSITSTGKYSRYALTDVLICGNCGTRYRRVTWSRNGVKRIVWRCISRLDYGKKFCSDSPTIMEDKLQEAIVRAVNKFNEQDNATYKALMRATISEALGLNGDPEEVDMLERKVEALNNKMLALVNESVSSGDGIEAHESEFMTLSQETELLKQRIAAIQESTAKDNGEQSRLEQIQAIISERESKCMEYDDSIVRQMVECIKVYPGGKLEIIFGGGYLVEESV